MNFINLVVIIFCFFVAGVASFNATIKPPQEPGSNRKACSKRGYVPQPPNRVDTTKRLKKLREHMMRENSVEGQTIQAYIITSDDEHQSEQVSHLDRRRQYISGFSGSAGDAIVTYNKSALWTDGRYHLQANDEINCDWLLMRHGLPDTPSVAEWLKANLEPGSRIGADPKLISNSVWENLRNELEKFNIRLVEVRKNLVDLIWDKESLPPANKLIYIWDIAYAGRSWQDKVTEVREELRGYGVDAMVVTALDEIAWLLNIRGRDIPKSPFVTSYILLSMDEIHFYVDLEKVTEPVEDHLLTRPGGNPFSVTIHPYEHIWTDLPTMSQLWNKVFLPSSWVYSPGVSRAIFTRVLQEKRVAKASPIMFLKAEKNEREIEGMEQASIRDSAALIEFLSHLEEEVLDGEYWDEMKIVKDVDLYRLAQNNSRGSSFETIAAFGPNGAKPHYETSISTNVQINSSNTLVLDSGGQYLDGTTDVTRTLHYGEPTEEQKFAYTKVLMGAIDMSSLIFPSNLKISAVDVLARAPLWQSGLDYMHGTGHGVGAFLGVHESPISVSYSATKEGQTFKVGNFFSNEPGYYQEGDFGVRLENILEVVHKFPRTKHYSGEIFLGFVDITLVPYEPKLIDYNMLTIYQRRWLNDYNTRIRSYVGAELKRRRKMDAFYWMMEKTKHIPEQGSYSAASWHSSCNIITITALVIIRYLFI